MMTRIASLAVLLSLAVLAVSCSSMTSPSSTPLLPMTPTTTASPTVTPAEATPIPPTAIEFHWTVPTGSTVTYENEPFTARWTPNFFSGLGRILLGCGDKSTDPAYPHGYIGVQAEPPETVRLDSGAYTWNPIVGNLAGGELCRVELLDRSGKSLTRSEWFGIRPSRTPPWGHSVLIVAAMSDVRSTGGIVLVSGQRAVIVATGSWTCDPSRGPVGPNGYSGVQSPANPLPDANTCAVVGQLGGGAPFLVSNSFSFLGLETGLLKFGPNEAGSLLGDNTGEVDVDVELQCCDR